MQGRDFVAGLLIGGIGIAVPIMMMTGGGDGSDPKPMLDANSEDQPSDELERLRRENDQLREKLRNGAFSRAEVDTTNASGDGSAGEVAEATTSRPSNAQIGDPAAHRDELLQELERLFKSGALHKIHGENPDQLLVYLINSWLQVEQPEEAYGLLCRFNLNEELAQMASYVADHLLSGGNRLAAINASLLAVRNGNHDWNTINRLMELAPRQALEALAGLTIGEDQANDINAKRSLLLLAANDSKAALEILDQLLENDAVPNNLWEQLAKSQPDAAEQRLRAKLNGETDPEKAAGLRMHLAKALFESGDRGKALGELKNVLESQPGNWDAMRMFGDLDRAKALEFLQNRTLGEADANTWGMYGEQLLAASRKREAIDAYWQAMELNPGTGWASYLLNNAPEQSIRRLSELARDRSDDELYGDIADKLWEMGRHDEAHRMWQQAHDIDEGDGEWTGKLAAVAGGRDPLNS